MFTVFAPVQLKLYQFKLFCTSSKTNCSKVKIELQRHLCSIVLLRRSIPDGLHLPFYGSIIEMEVVIFCFDIFSAGEYEF